MLHVVLNNVLEFWYSKGGPTVAEKIVVIKVQEYN